MFYLLINKTREMKTNFNICVCYVDKRKVEFYIAENMEGYFSSNNAR